jgi:hypothetical protein
MNRRLRRWRPVLVGLLAMLAGLPGAAEELPPGWRTVTLDACDAQPLTLTAPAPGVLRDQYSAFRLSLTREAKVSGQSLQWRFTPQKSGPPAGLHFTVPAPPPDALSLWVKNPRRHALGLAVRFTDGQGQSWQTPEIPLAEKANWTRHLWRLDQLGVAEGRRPVGELGDWQVVLSGVKGRESYELYLDELQAHYAPPLQVQVTAIQTPDSAPAGAAVPGELQVQIAEPLRQPLALQVLLTREGRPATLTPAEVPAGTAGAYRLRFELALPRYLRAGRYAVAVRGERAEVTMAATRELDVQRAAEEMRARVMPAGQGGCFAAYGRRLPVVGGLAEGAVMPEGWQWVMVPVSLAGGWGKEAKWAAVEERLAAVAEANPQAVLIPVIDLSAPADWLEKNPAEVMVYGDGSKLLPAGGPQAGLKHESWASTIWRQEAGAALTRLLEHLEAGPLGEAIIGYQLAAGEGGAWVYPGARQGVYADYGAPQHRAFREWLKRRYTTLQALRLAWGQPGNPVTTAEAQRESPAILAWEQVKVPPQARRSRGSCGVLHEPSMSQEVVDYQVFASDLVVETMTELAGVARRAAGERKLVGVAYGLLLDLAGSAWGVPNGGHLALAPLAQAGGIDFVVTPQGPPAAGEPPLLRTAHSSLTSHGKLWLATAPQEGGPATWAVPLGSGGVVAVAGGRASEAGELATAPLSGGRGSVSEVAVVVDDMSAAYSAVGAELTRPLLHDQRVGLSLLGAPCDVWLLDDVLAGRTPTYKLYVFLNAFYMDASTRTQLLQVLLRQPCTALWIYAAGGIDATIGGRGIKDLTGVTAAVKLDKGPLQVRVSGREGTYTYGASQPLWPRFVGLDSQGEARGVLVGTTQGGLISHQWGTFRSVWSAAPHLPASLLRELAREAGVHLYAEGGEGVYACEGLLGVRVPAAGRRTLRFPVGVEMQEARQGTALGRNLKELEIEAEAGEVRLYRWL